MKQSIKALLGITVLDSLGNDISRIITKTTKAASNPMEAKELETLRDKKAQADGALQAADDRIADLADQLDDTNKKLEKAKTDYAAKGGDIVAQRQELFNQRSRLTLRIEQEQEKLISAAAGELPLMLVKDLLVDIRFQKGTVRNLLQLHSKWHMRSASHCLVLFFIATEAHNIPHTVSNSSCMNTIRNNLFRSLASRMTMRLQNHFSHR